MASRLEIVNPPGWPRPKGFANAITGRGRMVFVAGIIGRTPDGVFESDDFVAQLKMTLANTIEILAAADARPEHVVRMTWYVVDRQEYLSRLAEVGECWRAAMGRHYPALALVEVRGLTEDRARLEIETTALVPD
jgi:enamine deaminase RidA (YjgF/YER057c/UK114 family)